MNIKKKFKKFSRRSQSQVIGSPRSSDIDKKSFTSDRNISVFFNGFRSKTQSRSSQSNSSLKSADLTENWQKDILDGVDACSSISSASNKDQQNGKVEIKKNNENLEKERSSIGVETDNNDMLSESVDVNLTELISNCEDDVVNVEKIVDEDHLEDDKTDNYENKICEDEFSREDSKDTLLVHNSSNVNMNTLSMTKELMQIRNENMKLKEQLNNQLKDALNVKFNKSNQALNPMQSPFSKLPGYEKSNEWMISELERLKSEFCYKEQLVNMLRSTLVNMRNQRQTYQKWHHHQQQNNLINSSGSGVWHMAQQPSNTSPFQMATQGPSDVGLFDINTPTDFTLQQQQQQQHPFQRTQSPQNPISQSMAAKQQQQLNLKEQYKNEEETKRKNVEELHKEVIFMESHIRILKDSLEDEKLENRDLIEENSLLKLQVQKLTVASEKLMEGMSSVYRCGEE